MNKGTQAAAIITLFVCSGCSVNGGSAIKSRDLSSGQIQHSCGRELVRLTAEIEKAGAKIMDFSILPDDSETSPHGPLRVSRLTIRLAGPEVAGSSTTPDQERANLQISRNRSYLLSGAKKITSSCDHISSVSIEMHETGYAAYLAKDEKVKLEKCIDIGRKPSWGERVCT